MSILFGLTMIFTGMKKMYKNIKVIAMDLDGTLTQHKTPLSAEHRAVLTELSKKYNLYRQTYCGCKFSIENQNKILKTKND